MKQVTVSQARKNWFRLLDEVAAGEVVVLERHGQRIVIRREGPAKARRSAPDYSGLISVKGRDEADRWTWSWSCRRGLVPRAARRR